MWFRVGLLLLLLGIGDRAQAEPLRAPLWGEPALQMEAPKGWTVSRGGWLSGDHFVIALVPGRAGLIALAMIERDQAPAPREEAQKIAGAEWVLDAGSTAASIDGHAAEAFTATERSGGTHPDRQARYLIARIDDRHLAVVIAIVAKTEADVDRLATDDAVASVHVIPPRSSAGN